MIRLSETISLLNWRKNTNGILEMFVNVRCTALKLCLAILHLCLMLYVDRENRLMILRKRDLYDCFLQKLEFEFRMRSV